MNFFDFNIHFDIQLDTFSLILLSSLGACFMIQVIYYWGFLARPYRYRKKMERGKIPVSNSNPPVSVIICARNEAGNLQSFLPHILEQDYPEYEVIVVTDDSSGNCEEVLSRMKIHYRHLYHTYIPQGTRNLSRKKLSVTLGIKAAKYDTLLFTEANAYPTSKYWLAKMVRNFSVNKTIVLGFSAFEKRSGFFNKFVAYDYFLANLKMMAMALIRLPYGANGRNLAYNKSHFYSQKGFSKHRFLLSGEDDLFINEVATKDDLTVELSPDSLIYIQRDGFSEWNDFRVNRVVTGHYYKGSSKFFLRIELLSRLLFYVSVTACLVYDFFNPIVCLAAIVAFILRLSAQLWIINRMAKSLNVEKYFLTLFFFDLMQPFVDVYYYIYRIFRGKRSYTWRFGTR